MMKLSIIPSDNVKFKYKLHESVIENPNKELKDFAILINVKMELISNQIKIQTDHCSNDDTFNFKISASNSAPNFGHSRNSGYE